MSRAPEWQISATTKNKQHKRSCETRAASWGPTPQDLPRNVRGGAKATARDLQQLHKTVRNVHKRGERSTKNKTIKP